MCLSVGKIPRPTLVTNGSSFYAFLMASSATAPEFTEKHGGEEPQRTASQPEDYHVLWEKRRGISHQRYPGYLPILVTPGSTFLFYFFHCPHCPAPPYISVDVRGRMKNNEEHEKQSKSRGAVLTANRSTDPTTKRSLSEEATRYLASYAREEAISSTVNEMKNNRRVPSGTCDDDDGGGGAHHFPETSFHRIVVLPKRYFTGSLSRRNKNISERYFTASSHRRIV